jgi:hypothetical protein
VGVSAGAGVAVSPNVVCLVKKRPKGDRQVVATIGTEDELVDVGAEMATRDALALSRPRPPRPHVPASPRPRTPRPRVPTSRGRFFRNTRPVRTTWDLERLGLHPGGWAARVVLRSGAAGPVKRPGALATTRFVP